MILLYTFLLLNLISFVLIGYDKKLAQNNKRRISEQTLLTFVSIGGTIGSGLGMLFFRHKTAKRSYLFKFWLIVIIQILIGWFCFLHYKI
jgi:uncharacterized membrane protein YsdA (DUF1294 family)